MQSSSTRADRAPGSEWCSGVGLSADSESVDTMRKRGPAARAPGFPPSRRGNGHSLAQFAQKRHQALSRAVAHETDLNPIPAQQVFTLVTEQETDCLKLVADRLRTDFLRQGKGDHRRAGVGVGRQ